MQQNYRNLRSTRKQIILEETEQTRHKLFKSLEAYLTNEKGSREKS